jgi:hypothetical protein
MDKEQAKGFESTLLEKRKNLNRKSSGTQGLATDSDPEYGRDEGDSANASLAKEMAFLETHQDASYRSSSMLLYRAFGTAHLVSAFIAAKRSVRSGLVRPGRHIALHARNSWRSMELESVWKSGPFVPHEIFLSISDLENGIARNPKS